MNPENPADTRSPWYEAFTPAAKAARQPAVWLIAQAEAAAAPEAAEGAGDEDWATEALFDYYNS